MSSETALVALDVNTNSSRSGHVSMKPAEKKLSGHRNLKLKKSTVESGRAFPMYLCKRRRGVRRHEEGRKRILLLRKLSRTCVFKLS